MFDALTNLTKRIFGDANERELKKLQPLVQRINELEPRWQKLRDEELAGKIVFLNRRTPRAQDGAGYGLAGPIRWS